MESIIEALDYISPDDYETWFKVGMALKQEGFGVEVWDSWSRGSTKYKQGECERKWKSFNRSDITGGTIVQWAKDNGYMTNSAMDWDDFFDEDVGRGGRIIDHEIVKQRSIPEPSREPIADTRRYLNLLFRSDDHVGYCDRLDLIDGKFVPKHGIYVRTAGEILKALDNGFEGASIRSESDSGAMIRFNPLDGEGESDANVTEFRYCLVESDSDSIEKQYGLYIEMKLPIVCLVYSGGKSLHAIVRIDAGKDHATYKSRVDFVYKFCESNGLKVDKNDKNASRYSRLPGIKRGENLQYIVAENIGFESYEKWFEWTKIQNDDLPKDLSLADIMKDLKPLKDELIGNVLRVGHKMLIAAPSKAGKSFLMMYLTVCFAEGLDWLGCRCKQGKVFYLNLELDEDSCNHRFADIYEKLGIEHPHYENINVWHLRGKTKPLDKLAPLLENRLMNKGYLAAVLDPIYKIITGDENNASEMGEFCAYLDRIATNCNVAIIYSHHHSKGAAGKYFNAVDRSSGSGVFARDPDAIVDLTELDPGNALDKYREFIPGASETATAWEMTATLREFPPMRAQRLWFDYPIHRLDDKNLLAEAKYSSTGSGKRGVGVGQKEKEDIAQDLEDYFDENTFEVNEAIPADVLMEELGLSEANLKKHVGKATSFERGMLSNEPAVFRRGLDIIVFQDMSYKRKPNGKSVKWVPI